ncbi:MAG: phosphoribosylglycinamide formyltransferase [Clostridiales bacterium]|jgi:phosphoribosylglycinamide formyltransferase-1|nr:phosphoribosylglycinamide formyltransferase [Clostridiales bacterium]
MLNIAALVSGGGTNLERILARCASGYIPGRVVRVISSRDGAYALTRAARYGVPSRVVRRGDYPDAEAFETALADDLKSFGTELVLLAGYMTVLGGTFLDAFPERIMNVHPSLIPSFCGAGLYGIRVHEAALAKGVKVTGATVHFAAKEPDAGPIILQKAVAVEAGDTPEILQRRVMEEAEWEIYPEAARLFCEGRLRVSGGRAEIIGKGGIG